MGGRNTSRSPRVTSSGNIRPVSSNSVRRSSASVHPKRRATPGRYHTGSSATLVTTAAPESRRMTPSGRRRPASMARPISGTSTWALVMAMVGRMSKPWARYSA